MKYKIVYDGSDFSEYYFSTDNKLFLIGISSNSIAQSLSACRYLIRRHKMEWNTHNHDYRIKIII